VHCTGGLFCQDSDQEVPNIMHATYQYDDGMIIQMKSEIYTLIPRYSGPGNVFIYSDQGWMTLSEEGFKTFFGPKDEPGPSLSIAIFRRRERQCLEKLYRLCQEQASAGS